MLIALDSLLRAAAIALLCAIGFGVSRDARADAAGVCAALEPSLRAPSSSGAPGDCASPARGVERWLSEAETSMKRARYPAAKRALECAARSAGRMPTANVRYDLARLRGILAYRTERIDRALPFYECAAQIARSSGDREGLAKMRNNSAIAWHRLGQSGRALAHLRESMRLREAMGREPTGANWMNLADIHDALGETDRAMAYYESSFRAYARAREIADMAHVRQTMATRALQRGDLAQARRWLDDVVSLAKRGDATLAPFRLRAYAALADLALREDDLAAARRWIDEGQAFVSASDGLRAPVDFSLQAARLEIRERDADAALRRLNDALAALPSDDADRARVFDALSHAQQAAGDLDGALRSARAAQELDRARDAMRRNAQTAAIRQGVAIDRAVAEARARERLGDRRLRAFAILAVVVAALTAAAILRARWRARLREVEQHARHQEEVARYRRLADELRVDRAVLEASLDSRDDAVCVIDGCGQIVAANRRAAALFDAEVADLVGVAFVERLPEDARPTFVAALERLDDGIVERVAYRRECDDTTWCVEPSDRRYGDGAIFLRLAPAVANSAQPPAVDPPEARHVRDSREGFHAALVELMLSAVDAWERSTGLNRLELAERSRIWRVSIDDGRLRARTMDRYLSLSKFPQNPHWRDVLRTAYYVLAQCPLDEHARAELQRRVEAVLGYTRRDAMV